MEIVVKSTVVGKLEEVKKLLKSEESTQIDWFLFDFRRQTVAYTAYW